MSHALGPPVMKMAGSLSRAAAISMPGTILSQLAMNTMLSYIMLRTWVSLMSVWELAMAIIGFCLPSAISNPAARKRHWRPRLIGKSLSLRRTSLLGFFTATLLASGVELASLLSHPWSQA